MTKAQQTYLNAMARLEQARTAIEVAAAESILKRATKALLKEEGR